VPMKTGFRYLTAIIDIYSRFIVGWQIASSLDKETQTTVLHKAIARYGKPEIINSDQGSQYTCEHWVSTLKELGIEISMDVAKEEQPIMLSKNASSAHSSVSTST